MRSARKQKRWAATTMLAMVVSTFGTPAIVPTTLQAQSAPVGAGFRLNAGDLRFIFRQIEIAQDHAAGGQLFGLGPNQVPERRIPWGLRTVDGSFNHLDETMTRFGSSDQLFPRVTTPEFIDAEPQAMDFDGPGPQQAGDPSTYKTIHGVVTDSQPRVISNLIVDQTANNPAAIAAAERATGGLPAQADESGTLDIPNLAPDVALSAPFNGMFVFFGQFFDHGLDLVAKSPTDIVFMPLQADDPLIPGPDGELGTADDLPGNLRFMALNRSEVATVRPGPDGIAGTADDIRESKNKTTPFVDQNQTYTSHPSHQVFLRAYEANATTGRPQPTGKLIDGAMGNIGNWGEVKAQARTMLGIQLVDMDVLNIPLILTDPYGHFKPGTNGYPQIVTSLNPVTTVEGNPAANGGLGVLVPANAIRTGHQFLDDIAHAAVPNPQGEYDQALLESHFCTGDGRGNENIALTAVHTVFHSEHNRLAEEIAGMIDTHLTPAEAAAWRAVHTPSGWGFGERLFQAARFVTEMQYQHLVFEEFARKVSPGINAFVGDGINFINDINPAIVAEFAHVVYRFGHSMLTSQIARELEDGSRADIDLIEAFLNPHAFNHVEVPLEGGGTQARVLNASQAAGAVFAGGTRQVAQEIDEFKVEALRNNLLGLPLDLAAINIARGRSEGIPSLNAVRSQLYQVSGNSIIAPYLNWSDFQLAMRNPESVVNYIAAYGRSPLLDAATTLAEKRAAAFVLFDNPNFMLGDAEETGLNDVDLWIGGLAEKQSPFGGLLGATFNEVFEVQLEKLQNGDRFYYLERLDGLNLLTQMEANSFAELIARNTTAGAGFAGDVFARPGLVFNLDAQNATGPIVDDLSTENDERLDLIRQADNSIRYAGAEHVIWNGSDTRADFIVSSEGDDTLKGNGGNDRIEGGTGNDQPIGGAGDDILTDTFGDDVIKGGPGHDAINGGFGPFDLLQGNEGNDFVVGGNDSSEVFGGEGNDVIYVGVGLTESFGGSGDDWIEGSDSPASVLVGDDNNQFQNDPNGGHDVIQAGPGDADFDMEGGDDIGIANVIPTHRIEGMLGFDWATYRGETRAVDADFFVTGATTANAPLNELRDRYDNIEGLSGTAFNDLLRGDDRAEADLRDDGLTGVVNGHVLTSAGMARIDGITALLPAGATEFAAGNIILGGAGSDTIMGRGGNDIIDGDRWLNVQLEGTLNGGQTKRANTLQDLKNDVFANPQRLNPGNIRIVREIISTGALATDVDVAEFQGNRSEYAISVNANGSITVAHVTPGVANLNDGVDTLFNIERLKFLDVTVSTTGVGGTPVPNVQGLSLVAAQQALVTAGLTPGTVTSANNNTIPAGQAIGTDPLAGVGVQAGSTVNIIMSLGPLVPDVHDTTIADAAAELALSGLVVGQIGEAFDPEIPAGLIATQSPLAGETIAPGGAVNLFLSKGPAPAGLVLSLGFDLGTATDGSGEGNHGSVSGAVPAPGRIGTGSLSFDGVNDMVVVPNSDTLGLETAMTLEAWVNPSARTPGQWDTVMVKEGLNTFAYEMYANNDTNRPAAYFMSETGALRNAIGTAALPLGAWTHLASTWDGTTMRLFVNGTQVRSVLRAGPMLVTDGQLSIGGNVVWGGEFFAGRIDEVKIYNRALTAAEIASDMEGQALPPAANNPPTAGGDTQSTTAGTPVLFTAAALLANDADANGDALEITAVAATSVGGGTIVASGDEQWLYTPAAGFSGADSFTYTVSDGRGGSAVGTVNVSVGAASTGLVLALGFNEASGNTAADRSGNGNNGTVREATVAAGKFGNARSFDGVNDWVTVADSASLDVSTAMTLEAWVRPTANNGWNTVMLKEAGATMAYEMYSNNPDIGRPAAYVTTAGGALRAITGTAAASTTDWTHIAVTYDGVNMRMYVNGSLVRSAARAGAILQSNGVLHIGGNQVWGGEWFSGLIDEVRIYNRALTAGEIQTDMNTPIVP